MLEILSNKSEYFQIMIPNPTCTGILQDRERMNQGVGAHSERLQRLAVQSENK